MIGQHVWLVGSGAAGAAQSLASATDIHTWLIPMKCTVIQAGCTISTLVNSAASAVVEFDRIPKHGGVREAAFASLTIPTGTIVGDTYWDVPATVKTLYPGDLVTVQVATAATVAGEGRPYLIVEPVPERPANVTGMTESA